MPNASWSEIEREIPEFLRKSRWFGGKSREIRRVEVVDRIPFSHGAEKCEIYLVKVEYSDGGPAQFYQLPLMWAYNERAAEVRDQSPRFVLWSSPRDSEGNWSLVFDATASERFGSELLRLIIDEKGASAKHGVFSGVRTKAFRPPRDAVAALVPRVLSGEQSNSSIVYGKDYILKLFRRLESGPNPDVEIGRFLTGKFNNTPPIIASLEYKGTDGTSITFGSLQAFVPNDGDAWRVLMAMLAEFCNDLLSGAPIDTRIKPFVAMAELLGKRTRELHEALASDHDDPAFKPEPLTLDDQRKIHQSLLAQADAAFATLATEATKLDATTKERARRLIALRPTIENRFEPLLRKPIKAMRTRSHGDYHLGQVLYDGRDFFIIDFEGEPARTLDERRAKFSPLRDVAGMLRSFHYAAYVATSGIHASADKQNQLEQSMNFWHSYVCEAYLKGYFGRPYERVVREDASVAILLDVYRVEKALYELLYEINNRPDWVRVPISGLLEILETNS